MNYDYTKVKTISGEMEMNGYEIKKATLNNEEHMLKIKVHTRYKRGGAHF
jgi:hypothetical protein